MLPCVERHWRIATVKHKLEEVSGGAEKTRRSLLKLSLLTTTRSFAKTNSGQTPQGKLNQQKHPVWVCGVCALFVFAGIVASSMALFGVDGTPLRDSESLTSYPAVSNGATLMISGPRPVNKHAHAGIFMI